MDTLYHSSRSLPYDTHLQLTESIKSIGSKKLNFRLFQYDTSLILFYENIHHITY